jgi:outer membrane protein TolC
MIDVVELLQHRAPGGTRRRRREALAEQGAAAGRRGAARGGLASKLDVFRAELQLSQAEDAVIFRKEALELALDSFKFNLGLAPSDQVALEMVEPDYQPVDVDVDALTATALQRRIEMREENDRIQDAQRSLAVSRQNLLPQVDLNWRYEPKGL